MKEFIIFIFEGNKHHRVVMSPNPTSMEALDCHAIKKSN